MSKYISPWHLSLLCSIFALMHWQQLIAGITNVGDPRLVAKQPTACHQLVLQLSNWHSLPLSEMEQAALNRMAQSIAQLTLCQVTGEEIATATKLLEKACQKLRASLKFSRSLTLNSRRCPARALELTQVWWQTKHTWEDSEWLWAPLVSVVSP